MSHNTDAQNQTHRGMSTQIKMETTHYGMRITMPVSPDEEALLELLARIPSDAYHLPQGEAITLDFQERACSPTLLVRLLQEVVWDKRLRVAAWISSNEESLELFQSAGLVVTEPPAPPDDLPHEEQDKDVVAEASGEEPPDVPSEPEAPEEFDEEDEEYESVGDPNQLEVVRSSMRSGEHLESAGDVIVWGHLNSGAEITAGGSVVVAGRLRGLVHAGSDGRKGVFIQAGAFEAAQVRLGRKIGYADETTPGWGKSVLITVEEDGALAIRENTFLKPPPETGAWAPAPENG